MLAFLFAIFRLALEKQTEPGICTKGLGSARYSHEFHCLDKLLQKKNQIQKAHHWINIFHSGYH